MVTVYAAKSGKPLVRVETSELTFDVLGGEVEANVQEVPYGRQSLVIYNDFDFDGRRDLAIIDGHESCYHGPSFRIFLRRGSKFEESAPFSPTPASGGLVGCKPMLPVPES